MTKKEKLLYRFASHLLNQENMFLSRWAYMGSNLLNELKELDPEKYEKYVGKTFYGAVLPAGDRDRFDKIEAFLKKHKVQYWRQDSAMSGSTVFALKKSEISKLPKNAEGPYLPTHSKGGYVVHELPRQKIPIAALK